MADLHFYTNPMSRGQIARWMLEETGCPYEEHILPFGPKGTESADFVRLNPMRKVPTITHGDQVVTEAAAIGLYLAHVFPDAGLGPEPGEVAGYYRWTLFAAGPLEQAVVARAMGWPVPDDPEKQGMLGFGSFERTLAALEGHLAGRPYVCGARFTMVDCYVGAHVDWGLAFGTLPERPALLDYVARLRARETYKRAKARDAALIAEQNLD